MPGWNTTDSFDGRAAATRSFLGWGVVAGPFYLLVAVIHALLKPGFDFTKHALSLLMVTDTGWVQRANLILVGLMVIAADIGFVEQSRDAAEPGCERCLSSTASRSSAAAFSPPTRWVASLPAWTTRSR